MKKILIVLLTLFSMILISGVSEEQPEMFYVHEYDVIKLTDRLFTVKRNICFKSTFKFTLKRKEKLIIETDSTKLEIYVLFRKSINTGYNSIEKQTEYLCGIKDTSYAIRERTDKNGNYYFACVPVKFNGNSTMGGHGRAILVSNKNAVCDSLIFNMNINYGK